jgi:tape measure domain-containing protein
VSDVQVKIKLTGDSADAKRAINDVSGAVNSMTAAMSKAQSLNNIKIAAQFAEAGREAKAAANSIGDAMNTLGVRSFAAIDGEIAQLTAAFNTLKTSGKLSADEIGSAYGALQAKLQKLNAEKGALDASKEIDATTNSFKGLSGSLVAFGSAAAAIVAVKAAVSEMIGTSGKLDSVQKSLAATSGSAQGAAESMAFVRTEASRMGLELTSAAKAFAGIQASAAGTVLEGENTRKIFSAVSGAMSALGKSSAETEGALLAIGQMMSKGTVSAEELRGQLGERMPGAFNIMARAIGVSTAELSKMLEQGQVGIDVLPKFAEALNTAYGDQSFNSIESNINRIKTAWDNFVNSASEALGVAEKLQTLANAVTPESSGDKRARLKNQLEGYDSNSVTDQLTYRLRYGENISETENTLKTIAAEERKAAAIKASNAEKAKSLDISKQVAEAEGWAAEIDIADEKERYKQREQAAKEAAAKAKQHSETAAKAEQARAQSIKDIIEQLQFEISIEGLSNDQKQIATALRNATKKATNEEADAIEALIKQKYADIDATKRQQAAWDESIKNANALVDIKKSISEFGNADTMSVSGMAGMMGRIQDIGKENDFNPEQMKALYDQLGTAWNQGFIEPAKQGTHDLSEFAKQAARNIQTAFADFLFDPFKQGLDGMALGFLDTIRRMLANAVSANIMEGLFGAMGKGGGKDGGGLGGLLGAGASWISSFFHSGGVIGDSNAGSSRAVNPAIFFNAPRYHTGGIASDEVPAVLQKGEEVLTANDPRHRNNIGRGGAAGGGASNVTSIVVMDPNFVPDAMSGAAGSQIVINHIRDNASSIKRVLESA